MQPKPSRPTGVTILGILAILGGIVYLLASVALIGIGLLVGTLLAADVNAQLAAAGYPGLQALGAGLISTVLLLLGVVALVIGVMYLLVGVGFFSGKSWSWTLGVLVNILGIVVSIVQIAFGAYPSIVGLVIGIAIVYYLMRPHVKSFFGKGTAAAAGPSVPQM